MDVDVAIIGGGIAGSSLANTLAQNGARVLIVEHEPTYEDGRAILTAELAVRRHAIVALHDAPSAQRLPSSRRWPARSRPANLPGRNGSPPPSPRSALATRGRGRAAYHWRGSHLARPSGTAWAHCSSPASPRRRPRSHAHRRARPRWGSAGATSASAVAPRQARRTAVGTPPSPRRRGCAGWPSAGSAQ